MNKKVIVGLLAATLNTSCLPHPDEVKRVIENNVARATSIISEGEQVFVISNAIFDSSPSLCQFDRIEERKKESKKKNGMEIEYLLTSSENLCKPHTITYSTEISSLINSTSFTKESECVTRGNSYTILGDNWEKIETEHIDHFTGTTENQTWVTPAERQVKPSGLIAFKYENCIEKIVQEGEKKD